jgi:hypothetical protein
MSIFYSKYSYKVAVGVNILPIVVKCANIEEILGFVWCFSKGLSQSLQSCVHSGIDSKFARTLHYSRLF